MFNIHYKTENGFDIVVLQDELTGCFAEIIPSCAAMLHAFGISKNGDRLQVIESFKSFEEYTERVEPEGYKGCKLSPFVCRVYKSTFSFGGQEFTFENRSGGNHALHGLLYNKSFNVIDTIANEMHASITMKYSYKGNEKGFPFRYSCAITWELAGDCTLKVKTEVENLDEGLIPIQDGWHPYFQLGNSVSDLELEFQSKNILLSDEDLIPTGRKVPYEKFIAVTPIHDLHFDNCFELDLQECQPLCVLRSVEMKVEIKIFPGKSYPYLQLYTPENRHSIAIENISDPSNGFNSGNFTTLEPGQIAAFTTAYQINLLNQLV